MSYLGLIRGPFGCIIDRLYKSIARKPWLNGLPRACTLENEFAAAPLERTMRLVHEVENLENRKFALKIVRSFALVRSFVRSFVCSTVLALIRLVVAILFILCLFPLYRRKVVVKQPLS